MIDDLVKQLLAPSCPIACPHCGRVSDLDHVSRAFRKQAADRIEALEAENARLRDALGSLVNDPRFAEIVNQTEERPRRG